MFHTDTASRQPLLHGGKHAGGTRTSRARPAPSRYSRYILQAARKRIMLAPGLFVSLCVIQNVNDTRTYDSSISTYRIVFIVYTFRIHSRRSTDRLYFTIHNAAVRAVMPCARYVYVQAQADAMSGFCCRSRSRTQQHSLLTFSQGQRNAKQTYSTENATRQIDTAQQSAPRWLINIQ